MSEISVRCTRGRESWMDRLNVSMDVLRRLAKEADDPEIAPELTGHGLPLIKCEAYNRVYDQSYRSR